MFVFAWSETLHCHWTSLSQFPVSLSEWYFSIKLCISPHFTSISLISEVGISSLPSFSTSSIAYWNKFQNQGSTEYKSVVGSRSKLFKTGDTWEVSFDCILDFRYYSSFPPCYFLWFLCPFPCCWASLQPLLWTLVLINRLPPFHLALFLEIPPILKFGACFFVSPFLLPLCVCFYMLNRTAMTSRFGGVAFCSRCSMRASGAVS